MATNKAMWTADARYYLNSKGEAVKKDDADRQSLLVAEGGSLPMERAIALGLVKLPQGVSIGASGNIQVTPAEPVEEKPKAPAKAAEPEPEPEKQPEAPKDEPKEKPKAPAK